MEVEQNTISRDWAVLYKGRRFFINFTESDGQTLVLCNRDNWQIQEETDEGVEELNTYVFNNNRPEEYQRAEENTKLIEKLISFCIDDWDNEFMHKVWDELVALRSELKANICYIENKSDQSEINK